MGSSDILVYVILGIFALGAGVLLFLSSRASGTVENNHEEKQK